MDSIMDPSKKASRQTEIIEDFAAIVNAQQARRKPAPKKNRQTPAQKNGNTVGRIQQPQRKPAPKKQQTQAIGRAALGSSQPVPRKPVPTKTPGASRPSGPQYAGISKPQPQPKSKLIVKQPPSSSLREQHGVKSSLSEPSDKKPQSNLQGSLSKVNLNKLPKIAKKTETIENGKDSVDRDKNRVSKPVSKPRDRATQPVGLRRNEQHGLKKPAVEKTSKNLPKTLNKKHLEKPPQIVKPPTATNKKPELSIGNRASRSDELEAAILYEMWGSPEPEGKKSEEPVERPASNKRKCDNKPEPTQAHQTPKKVKVHHANGQITTPTKKTYKPASTPSHNIANFHSSPIMKKNKLEPSPHKSCEKQKIGNQIPDDERVQWFMTETGLDPDNLDNSTKVVRLKREDRILTASKNPKTGQPILHDTSVPSARNRPSVPVAQPTPVKERPFMKKGKHGRGGDFENDVDRQTGHGHQVSGVEELRLARYLDYRGDVYKKYPKYPAGEDISSEVKQGWRESELWYMGFKERYPGNGVMHLWPCGCEKMRGDSEDEESEEE